LLSIQFVILEFVGYGVPARGHLLILFDEDSQCGGDWQGGFSLRNCIYGLAPVKFDFFNLPPAAAVTMKFPPNIPVIILVP
jgi:hypothetical protein